MTQTLSTRTVCCKLSLDADAVTAIRATAEAFNAAATYCASVAWEEHIINKNKLHHVVYGSTRVNYGLGAQLACCARDKAAEAVRAARAKDHATCPTFKPDSAIRYDARTYRLMSLDRVSLNTLTGRVVGHMVLGAFQRRYLYDTSWKVGGAELVQRDGQFYLHMTQTKASPKPDEPTGFLGVDLGIVNLAADSEGETYSGADVQRVRERRFQHRQRLQTANTRRARWRLRKNARKESRFQRDVNHCISKALVQKARTARKALAVEDLTKIRERVTVRRAQRRARHSWAFRQLRSFLAYKAAQAGVVLVAVDPRNTSRTCAVCGYCEKANRPDRSHFRCLSCGHTAAADTNAAVNIASRAASQTAYCAASPSGEGASTSPPVLAVGI
ncbi:RNA-guided endonuclease InsQ/TnpB family protein [Candidatus Oscillochloris fontis]|uniref:RNA-guided endonuclease InsQ/TnpB family protein n=1 Tax=Candidatus Oscillochloris fontis TaxID=2496868 RepID=UPI00101D45EC|nr:RNA-guided endonuclease TnpB family protein [Candidatus Oscillochloris fontis]